MTDLSEEAVEAAAGAMALDKFAPDLAEATWQNFIQDARVALLASRDLLIADAVADARRRERERVINVLRCHDLSSAELKLVDKHCDWPAFKHAFNAVQKARRDALREEDLLGPDPYAGRASDPQGGCSAATRDVLAERERQKSAEGWTPEHDDQHDDGSLAIAARCYVLGAEQPHKNIAPGRGECTVPTAWPASWGASWWKPSDRRRNLVKAGALILAEIERLDRAPPPPRSGGEPI